MSAINLGSGYFSELLPIYPLLVVVVARELLGITVHNNTNGSAFHFLFLSKQIKWVWIKVYYNLVKFNFETVGTRC